MLPTIILATVVSFILCSLIWDFVQKRCTLKTTLQDLPGPQALPIIGHLHLIGSKSLHVVLKELSDIYGSVFQLKLGSRQAVILCDRESVYEAFVKNAKDFAGRPNLPTFEYTRNGRTGVSMCDYSEDYVTNRKKTVRAIRHMLADKNNLNEILTAEATKMMKYVDTFADSTASFYPMEEFQKVVPSLFMFLMFGHQVSYDDQDFLSIVSTYRKWFDAAEADNPADFFTFLRCFPNKRLSIIEGCGYAFEEFSMKMINYRKRCNENNNKEEQNCLLKHLMDESVITNEEDEKELAKVVSDLVGGGFDTSVASLSWALLYLVNQPDVLEKCKAEILKATGKGPVSMDIKDKCPYFAATIHEVYRLSSPAPTGLVHTTTKDTSVKGFFIPEGTLVMPNLWQLNHNADVWKDPEHLHPEHFLDDKGAVSRTAVKESAAFSSGIRRCPAMEMASSMNFVLLGSFIKAYDWTLVKAPKDMHPLRGVTAKPKHYLLTVSKS